MDSVARVGSTPQKPTTGGNVSNTQTRDSVDQFLADDYKNNAYSSVSVRTFLDHVFGFDEKSASNWGPKTQDILASCKEEVKAYRDKLWISKETDLYKPFVALANAIVKAADKIETGRNLLRIKFLEHGDKAIKGVFGKRKPDVLTLPGDVDEADVSWEQVLLAWEFKRAPIKRPFEEEEEAAISSESKRLRISKGKGSKEYSTSRSAAAASTSSAQNAVSSRSKNANPKASKIQLTSYVAEMFASEVFREWACGVSVDGRHMTLRYYDRTCSISTYSFNYSEENIDDFVLLLIAIRSCDYLKLGYSNLFRYADTMKSMALKGSILTTTEPIKQMPDKSAPRMDWKGDESIKLEGNLHTTYAVFGRATVVYKVKVGFQSDKGWEDRTGKESLVIKASWQVKTRKPEEEIVKVAREVDPEHTPMMFISFTRERVLPSDKLKEFCEEKGSDWEARSIRFIVFRQYRPLYELKGDIYFAAFVEIVICHWVLYEKGNILHRDLSINNLMYDVRNGRIVGILNDFDLAVVLNKDKSPPPPSSNHRTGTAAFMAHHLLDARISVVHSYRHDLESFLYIVIWTAVGYKGSWHPSGRKDPLRKWRRGTWLDIADAKSTVFSNLEAFEAIKAAITEDYKPLAAFIESFYLIFSSAFGAVNHARAEYLKSHPGDYENGQKLVKESLEKKLSWEEVESLFKKKT